MPTEAEQNRLIIENTGLVEPIAATFRGKKGIPFEDLTQEGMRALCQAARDWRELAPFPRYAMKYIEQEIRQFVAHWQVFYPLGEEGRSTVEDRVHEWQVWGILPSEGWTRLGANPEEIRETYELFAHKQTAVEAAMLSLTPRQRKMIHAHFMQKPRVTIAQIARDNRMSYFAAVNAINKAVNTMRDVVAKQSVAV